MGDIILTTPVIRALHNAFPKATMAYLAETPYISLLENHPLVHKLFPFDLKSYQRMNSWQATRAQFLLLKKIRHEHFELAFDLFGNPRSALQIWLSRARIRVGGDFSGRGKFYNVRVNYRDKHFNAIEFHLHAVQALGIEAPKNPRTEIFTSSQEDKWAKDYLLSKAIDFEKPIIGIHPGATWPAKMWPIDRFSELIRTLTKELDIQVYLTQGPGEENLIEGITSKIKFNVFTGEVLTLRKLAAILKQFTLYVSNDCGPLHLSVAVGTRSIGLFGPSEPHIWFPYSEAEGHRCIHHPQSCWPCHKDFCETLDCMKAITVAQVIDAIEDTLKLVIHRKKMNNLD